MFSFLTDSELQTRIQYVWKLDAIKNNALEKLLVWVLQRKSEMDFMPNIIKKNVKTLTIIKKP